MSGVRSVLHEMQSLALANTPESRGQLCDRFVSVLSLIDEEPSESEWRLISDIYQLIVRDVEKIVRRKFADELLHHDKAPRSLIKTLCNDEIDIARELLTASRVLLDDDLIDIVANQTTAHRVSIGAREQLSEFVSSAIVTTGDSEAIQTVLRNETARISGDSFIRIADLCSSTKDLHEPLILRKDVPWQAVERVVSVVSNALLQTISQKWDIPKAELMEMAFNAEEAAKDELYSARGDLEEKFKKDTGQNMASNRIESQIIEALGEEDPKNAINLIRDWASLDSVVIRTILNQKDLRLLATIFKAKGVDRLTFSRAAVALLGQIPDEERSQLRRVMEFYNAIDRVIAVSTVQRWRTDPRAFGRSKASKKPKTQNAPRRFVAET